MVLNDNINLSLVKKNLYLNKINKHVRQKNPFDDKEKIIKILTIKSKKYGLGHYKRSEILKREITETISSNVKLINLENENYNQIKKINNQNVIIDLPQQVLKRVENTLSDNNKIILIDQTDTKIKDKVIIVPSLFIIKKIPNIYFGKDYLIIDRKLSYEFVRNKILNKKPYINLIVFGGSKNHLIRFFLIYENKKKKNF